MSDIKLLSVVVVLSLLIAGCSKKDDYEVITVSRITTEESDTGTIYDGTYLYDFDFTSSVKSNKRIPLVEDYSQALYIYTPSTKTVFTQLNDYQYSGDYNSVMTYVDKLKANSYSLHSISANSKYLDVKLESSTGNVRIIYTEPEDIKIFCYSSEGIYTDAPYINEEDK